MITMSTTKFVLTIIAVGLSFFSSGLSVANIVWLNKKEKIRKDKSAKKMKKHGYRNANNSDTD